MPRPKRSTYGGPKLDDLDVEHLYPPDRMDAILRLFKPPGPFDPDKATTAIKSAAAWLNAELKRRRGYPNASQKRIALKQVADQLAHTKAQLDDLDPYSEAEIAAVAARADRQYDDMPLPQDALGRHRVKMAKAKLDTLLSWMRKAEQAIAPDEPGRARYDEERGFVEKLRDLWLESTPQPIGKRKKASPHATLFKAFVRAAISPVCEQFGPVPKLDNICDELL